MSSGDTTIFPGTPSGVPENNDPTRTINLGNAGSEELTPEQIRALIDTPDYNHVTDYEELHTIGIGGFGAIYGAREKELNRKVALKILRPRFRQAAERVRAVIREARSTAQIEHPNIVPVHRLGYFEDAGIYFSMKRVSGETLRAILRKLEENLPGYRRKYTLTRLLDIFLGTCRGVSYAHYNGLVHCDLKPENLMVGNFGEVLVMDWGSAHYLPELDKTGNRILEASHRDFTELGGTPVFMAPEHLSLTSQKPTAASDIYSLGCILYTILTWKRAPFNTNGTLEEVQKEVVRGKLIPPHRVAPKEQIPPRELEAICLKAMSRKAEDRYQSVDELIADIQDYRDNRPVKAYSPSWFYIFGKMLARHLLIIYTLILALICWFGFTLYGAIQQQMDEQTLRDFAIQNFNNGKNRILSVKRNFQKLAAEQNITEARKIEAEISANTQEAENFYNSALDFLSRMSEASWKKPTVSMMVQQIFYDLARLHIARNEDKKLYALASSFTYRWGKLFNAASQYTPGLRLERRKIMRDQGRLLIVTNQSRRETPQIFDRRGNIIPCQQIRREGGFRIYEYILRCGQYRYRTILQNGTESSGPVQIGNTRVSMLSLIEPEKIPAGMVFIPGGSFKYSSQFSRYASDFTTFPSFLIGKNEVTIREYLEFWRTLSPEEKIDYTGYYMRNNDSLYTSPIWDENGKILIRFLTEDHPVIGISAKAASAYCRYLSRKLGMSVTLPTSVQWLKAACGTDAGETVQVSGVKITGHKSRSIQPAGSNRDDVSIYGVQDMFGNVREFVRLSSLRTRSFGVIGSSYATPAELRGRLDLIYSSRGSNETGFRYVIQIPESGKFRQFL